MSGLNNTRRMPTRVTIAARKGGFIAPRRKGHTRKRQLVRNMVAQNSPASGRRVDLMRRKYVVKQRKTTGGQQTSGTSITIQPRIEIRTKRKSPGSPENPPAAPIKKRRISMISNNITQKMMIQVEPTPSIVTDLPIICGKYTKMQHPPKRNVVRRSEMKRFTINQAIEGSVATDQVVVRNQAINRKTVNSANHIFTKKQRAGTRVKNRSKVTTKPTTSLIVRAPYAEDDSSSAYSYSSEDSVSEDEFRRSKKNLGPVMKSTTVTRGGHIMLRNLPKEINARMLMMELFRDDGDVINAIVHSDDKGLQLGTGEVVFAKRKEAHNAIFRHCGSVWRGKKIKMTMIGQMIEQPMAKIMSRKERRRKDIGKKKRSLRPSRGWDGCASPNQNTMRVHQSPTKNRDDQYEVVEEPGGTNEEEHTGILPNEEAYEEEIVSHKTEHPDDTISKAMDRNGLVLDAGTQFSTREEPKTSDPSDKRKQQLVYIPAEMEDTTGYHVTLKNLQQYANLNELTDSDDGDFLRSS